MVNNINSIKLFEDKKVRSIWVEEDEKWYFSVVDVIEALTDSTKPRDYWYRLKVRVEEAEGFQLSTICRQLKLVSSDKKMYRSDVSDTQGILRIIQSIPSKKAEPFKQWLAVVGAERIEEIADPEIASRRAHELYKKKGYSEAWIEQRERGIISRNQLTDEWQERGANNGKDYAILTNEIYRAGFELAAKDYKDLKGVSKNQNLRDSMTELELALTNLGEVTAKELHKKNDSYGMDELKNDMKHAGNAVKGAREKVEAEIERPVVSKENYLDLQGRRRLN